MSARKFSHTYLNLIFAFSVISWFLAPSFTFGTLNAYVIDWNIKKSVDEIWEKAKRKCGEMSCCTGSGAYDVPLMWNSESGMMILANNNRGHGTPLYCLLNSETCKSTTIHPPTPKDAPYPRLPLAPKYGNDEYRFRLFTSRAILSPDGQKLYVTWVYSIDNFETEGLKDYEIWKTKTGRTLKFDEYYQGSAFAFTSEIYEIKEGKAVLKEVREDFRLVPIFDIEDYFNGDIIYIGNYIVMPSPGRMNYEKYQMQIIYTPEDDVFKEDLRGALWDYDDQNLLILTTNIKEGKHTAVVYNIKKRMEMGRVEIPDSLSKLKLLKAEGSLKIEFQIKGETTVLEILNKIQNKQPPLTDVGEGALALD